MVEMDNRDDEVRPLDEEVAGAKGATGAGRDRLARGVKGARGTETVL
jgi:hypothetical protein